MELVDPFCPDVEPVEIDVTYVHVFPHHDGSGPDVDPVTGDERITTDENGDPL